MKLTATQRLLAGMALMSPGQVDTLKHLSTLPEGVKASATSAIKFLTLLRRHCGTVRAFVAKLEEMLATSSSFTDLQRFGRTLYHCCRDDDLSTRVMTYPVGMVLHRPTCQQSTTFNSTLFKISNEVTPDQVDVMVTVTPIPDATKEKVRSGHALFSAMKQCGCISENDTEFLEDLLREMKLVKALEVLEHYKRTFPPVAFPPFVPAATVANVMATVANVTATTTSPCSSFPTPPAAQQQFGSSLPEVGGATPEQACMVLGRGYSRSSSSGSSLSSGNFSSILSGTSATLESGSVSSGGPGSMPSGISSLGGSHFSSGGYPPPPPPGHSLQSNLLPLSSGRFPPLVSSPSTSNSDDFRTAPTSPPAVATPTMQQQNPAAFNKSVSIPSSHSPSLASYNGHNQQQHPQQQQQQQQSFVAIPHNPIYPGPAVTVPLQTTPTPGLNNNAPSAPPLDPPPPVNPAYYPQGHAPGAMFLAPGDGGGNDPPQGGRGG